MSKTSVDQQTYAGKFEPGTPDQEVFELPKYCEKGDDFENEKIEATFSNIFTLFEN